MNSQGYIKIMFALAKLIMVIMIEAGKVPIETARKIASALLQASTGKKLDKDTE